MEDSDRIEPCGVWGDGIEEEAGCLANGYYWNDGPSSYFFGEDAHGDFCCYSCEGQEADDYAEFESCCAFFCDVEREDRLYCFGGEEEGYGRDCEEVEFFGEFCCGSDCLLVSFWLVISVFLSFLGGII